MPEQGVKFLCKRAIENGQRQLTPVEKELLKKGIDDAVKNKVCNDCTLYFLPHKTHPIALPQGKEQCAERTRKCAVYA